MVGRRPSLWLVGSLLVLLAQGVSAAPQFIASSRVTGDESSASVIIRFNCQASYLQHNPSDRGTALRIQLEPTSICNGVSPLAAQSRGRYRPTNADAAHLIDFEYEGDTPGGPVLTMQFSEAVSFNVNAPSALTFEISVDVKPLQEQSTATSEQNPSASHRQVTQPTGPPPVFVVNVASLGRVPTVADIRGLEIESKYRVFYSDVIVDGKTVYRVRVGDFETVETARRALINLAPLFPTAWVDELESSDTATDMTLVAREAAQSVAAIRSSETDTPNSEIAELMQQARLALLADERARAIQIYTKILQLPPSPQHADAQEFLALAREKNGQTAHAKAEYQRYLSLYPENEGAARVSQRLAALLATNKSLKGASNNSNAVVARQRQPSDWRIQTFITQYYRRDVNQPNDQDEVVSQSALYSDINFDVRKRGKRFDFSSRVTAGYRNDFLDRTSVSSSSNNTRISYAYVDLADAATGLRGRVGRQSRNSGGVLGRFDGLNIGYQFGEQILVNAVVGKPAYSSDSDIDNERTFYGINIEYGPIWDGLETGLFFIQQNVDGLTDRQAIGGEFRYFDSNKSIWGLVDFDTNYSELSSAFLQASFRLADRLSLNGSYDKRRTPFLTVSNAIIGQPVFSFSELSNIFSEDELRQLALDRSPNSTSYSIGVSYTFSPKIQVNVDLNNTAVDATPTSGGVFDTPANDYSYIATNFIASSVFKEGDVTIVGIRQSTSDTSDVLSLTVDSRYPLSRSWRLNPRLRIDRRERAGSANAELLYTPGIRIQYRRSQKFRIDFEAGKQFVRRDFELVDLDRESYFYNIGYQVFF